MGSLDRGTQMIGVMDLVRWAMRCQQLILLAAGPEFLRMLAVLSMAILHLTMKFIRPAELEEWCWAALTAVFFSTTTRWFALA